MLPREEGLVRSRPLSSTFSPVRLQEPFKLFVLLDEACFDHPSASGGSAKADGSPGGLLLPVSKQGGEVITTPEW